jgi:hypothetical protein
MAAQPAESRSTQIAAQRYTPTVRISSAPNWTSAKPVCNPTSLLTAATAWWLPGG